MKVCKDCGISKPLSDFYMHKSKKSGFQSYCKGCANIRRVEWARKNTEKTRQYKLKYQYGISVEEFEQMITDQNGKCSICSNDFEGTPNIDHDHNCCGSNKACKNVSEDYFALDVIRL